MKRCRRHCAESYDPYEEFKFEESLRKYQICPHKKIKLRNHIQPPISKPIPLQPNSLLASNNIQSSQNIFINDQSEKNQERNLSLMDGNGGQGPLEQQRVEEKEVEKQNCLLVEYSSKEQRLLGSEVCLTQHIQPIDHQMIYEKISNVGEKEVFTREDPINQHRDKSANKEKIQLQQDRAVSEAKDHTNSRQQEENREMKRENKPLEGRLNLSGNINISLRTLAKHRQQGWTEQQLLDEVLKQRTYLTVERQDVALRLRHLLHNN